MSEHIVTPEWIATQRKYYEAGVFTPVTMRSLANILHALDEVERLQATIERVRAACENELRWVDAQPILRALEGTQ